MNKQPKEQEGAVAYQTATVYSAIGVTSRDSSRAGSSSAQLTAKHPSTASFSSVLSSSSKHSGSQRTASLSDTRNQSEEEDGSSGLEESQGPQTWTEAELLEVRARERTFDGAYWRTAVGLFGSSLLILRVFGLAFFPVGLVFLGLGLGFLAIGLARRRKLISMDTHAQGPFVTSGGTVLLSGIMCLSAYATLLFLLLRI
ncbi:hypothetical protein GGI12_000467 [Dipsacomyces acuminosporus]|nr:hypothetical protein GGI12_000467 [Dipsacomyces acuminosporus]